ncbi:GMC family oxidoreductase [Streptomyces sp. Lzd4kr]|nr:GMC family oxidoreductase [Streptomyces sp. Lzd4kr]
MSNECTDVLVIGSGFGGAIPAYHLAAGGARVIVVERGPRLDASGFRQNMRLGGFNRIVDIIKSDGITAVAGNCVGGGSTVYFAASLRAPSFIFDREGGLGRRQWPTALNRAALDPWYERAEESLPVSRIGWADVSYAGGVFAAACAHAGRTCNPVPLAVDTARCTHCNWMLNGCTVDAKRSMLLNYLPAAEAYGATIKPLHEVQSISACTDPPYRYSVAYTVLRETDYAPTGFGVINAKIVVLAAGAMATPVILRRSEPLLGPLPRAVGRYLSGNGDRVSAAVMDEDRVHSVLGLSRPDGTTYEGLPIGMAITSASYDHLDGQLPEYSRFMVQQIYFPPLTNVLAQTHSSPSWFGVAKREMRAEWRSWLTLLAMTEDDNEGYLSAVPPTGGFVRLAPGLGLGSWRYRPTARTRRGRDAADSEIKSIIERDGLGKVRPWSEALSGTVTAHPLSSCRMGEDPDTSALTATHELRGHPGLFVTDGSAVPTSLAVNPSLTIAALAERAVPAIVERAKSLGMPVRYGAPAPDGSTAGRRVAAKAAQEVARSSAHRPFPHDVRQARSGES